MEKTKYTFLPGSTVQLKNSASEIYNNVYGGSTGFVQESKIDEYGFERVYIVWNSEDWRFQNAPPGWAYASHFTLKEPPPAKTPRPKRITKKDLQKRQELDAYMAELQKGVEALAGSEGFILFVAKRVPVEDDQTMVTPEVYAASHTQDADAVLGITLAEHMASTFEEMTMLLLEMFGDNG